MRWLYPIMAIFAAVSLTAVAAPAQAAIPKSDLAIRSTGEIPQTGGGTSYYVGFQSWNYGPDNTESDVVKVDIQAPVGTVFAEETERALRGGGAYFNCTIYTPHRHFRCTLMGSIWVSTYGCSPGKMCPSKGQMRFMKTGKCFGPGRYTFIYPNDPKSSNNSTRIPGPKNPASCTPKPSLSPSATVVSASPSPSESPAVTESESPLAGDTPPAEPTTADPIPVAQPDGGSGSSIAIYGAGALLVAAGGGAFWWLRRRRTEDLGVE